MGMIYYKDKPYAIGGSNGSSSDTDHVELTYAEYQALSEEEQKNGTIYFITDAAEVDELQDFYSKKETEEMINAAVSAIKPTLVDQRLYDGDESNTLSVPATTITYTGLSIIVPPKHVAILKFSVNNRSGGGPTIHMGYSLDQQTVTSLQSLQSKIQHNTVSQFYSVDDNIVHTNRTDTSQTLYMQIYSDMNMSLMFVGLNGAILPT